MVENMPNAAMVNRLKESGYPLTGRRIAGWNSVVFDVEGWTRGDT